MFVLQLVASGISSYIISLHSQLFKLCNDITAIMMDVVVILRVYGESLFKKMIFCYIFLNMDFSVIIYPTNLIFGICIAEIHTQGSFT